MKYAKLKYNDTVNGEGVCVSLWTQGCPHKCLGCFNPETWDRFEGENVPDDLKWRIIKAISANNIQRNFSILGGEPLAPYNIEFVADIVLSIREAYPDIKMFLWTGYTKNELFALTPSETESSYEENLIKILNNIDVIIDGRFIQEEKDLTLKLRGSKNQNIYRKDENGVWKKEND